MRTTRRMQILASLSLIAGLVVGVHSLVVSVPSPAALANTADRHIFLTLTDGADSVGPGGSLNYVVTVRTDSQNVEVTEVTLTLPAYANLVEASDAGQRVGNTIVWSNVAVSPVTGRRLVASVSVDPLAQIGATMTAEATCEGERAADMTAVLGSRVVPVPPELRLRISDGKEYAGPDEELRYVLTVENISDVDRVFDLRGELPAQLSFLAATGQYQEQDGSIRWTDQLIRAGDMRTFEVMAAVQHDVVDFTNIVFKAAVDGIPAGDTTVVQRQPVIEGFSITASDNLNKVTPASEVTYQIHLQNNDDILATGLSVSAALPVYAEFMEASNGGVWTGNNVRWENLTVSPHGDRMLTIIAHVRTDAPAGAALRMTAETQGLVAVDITQVVSGAPSRGDRPEALLSKTADRSEVKPGDTVTYTITLRNTTDHPFRAVRVEDRLDSRFMTVLGAERGQMQNGQLVWGIPELNPGQIWTVRYSVEISSKAPHGFEIDNVVLASGEGLETVSLTEKVYTSRLGVVRGLPPTGAAFDAIFLLLSGVAGFMQTILLKRRFA
ncbi:MAG: hypothetical protein PHX87_05475 [Candidatus Peribacteraceae bacterium]|nr:hypothetical protein [Candidatus Peribacteraceae bacterium]MDD5742843.1 hypothetical protein [Candidatus Peribacteraceae bacterium]